MVLDSDNEYRNRDAYGYQTNKDIPIKKVSGIHIDNFRSLKNKEIIMGKKVTFLVGRNATMKTSLMGLIAHPYDSDSKDGFGRSLKTPLSSVFRLSLKNDDNYKYHIFLESDRGEKIRESVDVYIDSAKKRHRIVVSGSEKGDGNFYYNTSFLNLKRLYPIVETNAKANGEFKLNSEELAECKNFYEYVLPSMEYSEFDAVLDTSTKTTFAPLSKSYDFNSMSSGEDNLGSIFNRLVGFMRANLCNIKGGILCIDEVESSLHPVAEINLYNYLYNFSQKYGVQVILTTHSLSLIQHLYFENEKRLNNKDVVINFISCSQDEGSKNYPILQNPDYSLAYKELTFKKLSEVVNARKINIFCEDEVAKYFFKKIIKKKSVLNSLNILTNLNEDPSNEGDSWKNLCKLCTNFSLLMHSSLVLFDADVPKEGLDKIKKNNLFIKLPDEENLAIERRIILFISNLEDSDKFFKKFDKEKTVFLDEFKKAGIYSLKMEHIKDQKKTSSDTCKNWVNAHKNEFKKYLGYYCDNHLNKENFLREFFEKINHICKKNGYPIFDGKI